MERRFAGRKVVITGAAGGLGRALAIGFAREGAELIVADLLADPLGETAALVRAAGGGCTTHVFDVAVEAEIAHFAAQVIADHPRIDLLYNNAGLAYGAVNRMVDAVGQADWLRYFAINSIAPMLLAQALRPALAAAKGCIINQSSMASFSPANAYGVTKATLNALTYGMATVFGPDGIRVNAIAPGLMETEANVAGLNPETHARVRGMQVLDGHGLPEDIVQLALFLASDAARFITAEVMSCDAGNRLRGWRY